MPRTMRALGEGDTSPRGHGTRHTRAWTENKKAMLILSLCLRTYLHTDDALAAVEGDREI